MVKPIGLIKRRVAIVGAGMTKFGRWMKETGKELSHEAAKMALDSAGLELREVDTVICGSAPDAFDGVHMKGDYLADGMGAWHKPFFRQYDGGSTGVGVMGPAFWTVASGQSDACLVVTEEKMSSGNKGVVHTYTIAHIDENGSKLKEPVIWTFVRIADGELIHKLGEIDPKDVRVGMTVEAVLKDKSDRVGSIKDIKYFKPV